MKKIISTIITFLFLPSFVLAAPSAPTVSGAVAHGQSISLSGTGFGTKSPVAPLLWDSVDGKYSGITNGGIVPLGGTNPWAEASLEVPVHFKTTNPRGKWTAHYTNTGTSNGEGKAGLGGNNYPGTTLLYASWWMWLDKTACTPSYSNKYTRFTDDGGWGSNVQTFIWAPSQTILFGVDVGDVGGEWIDTCGKTGWQRMESVIDNNTTPHPKVYLSVDNTAWGTQPQPISSSLSKNITGIGCIGFDGSNTPTAQQPTIDWGEVYVDNTRARVEICNNSVKANATHCEPQIPHTTWNSTAIQVTVNQGSFADSSSAYIIVSDSAGAWGTGTLITFGSSGGGDTTAPSCPSGLSIY